MLKLTTPNVEQHSGNSKLSTYTFYGTQGRKIFTLENTGPSSNSVTLSLSLTGASGGFKLFPADASSSDQTSINVLMNVNDKVSFSVDHDERWGTASSAKLHSDQDIYTSNGTLSIIGPTSSINFNFQTNSQQTKKELGILFCKDEDENYQITQAGLKISENQTSFGLIRTNPKLTGNVKITVDSNFDIWLNSIDATKELSDDRFKKFKTGKNSSFASDVNKFFDYGKTPSEIVFSLYESDSQHTSTKRNLDEQYDKFYQYGVTELKDKFYDEDFSFFAPLYIKKEIPDYFVIFKTDGPINKFSYDIPFEEWSSAVTSQILSNSKIVKTFSLSENTSVGSYLRNIISHPSRTESDLTLSLKQDGYTTYNGFNYETASFVNASELLNDYIVQENPLITVEEFITKGFERNKIFSSHIFNLEFLFNDETAADYSINRYFGLYVNSIDLAKFTIDGDALQYFSSMIDQFPLPRKGVDGNKVSRKSFVQTNENGISIFANVNSIKNELSIDPIKQFSSTVSSFDYDTDTIYVELDGNYSYRISLGETFTFLNTMGVTATATVSSFSYSDNVTTVNLDRSSFSSSSSIFYVKNSSLSCRFYDDVKYQIFLEKIFSDSFVKNESRFFYVRDNINNLHSIKSNSTDHYNITPFTTEKVIKMTLKDESIDMSRFGGFDKLLTQTDSTVLSSKGKSSMMIEISKNFMPNDYIEISWPVGSTVSSYPLRWRAVANSTALKPGESWPTYAISNDSDGEFYLSYFHPGDSSIDLKTFSNSIASAFNVFPYKDFEIISKDNFLFFKSTQDGRSSNNVTLKFVNSNESFNVMGITAPSSGSVYFVGGSDRKFTRAKISKNVALGMLIDEYVQTKGSYSSIKKYDIFENSIIFAPYLEDPIFDSEGKLIDFYESDTHCTVCVDDESQPILLTSNKKLTTYGLFNPTYGILSCMPLRDFDSDFFSSEYSKNYLPELIEYYGRYSNPLTVISISSSVPPIYTFDKEVSFDIYPTSTPYLALSLNGTRSPELMFDNNQFKFEIAGATAIMLNTSLGVTCSVGDVVLLMPDNKQLYFQDSEISKFTGFIALSSVVSSANEETFKSLENLWDPTRFTCQLLNSEYDRLSENYLKTLVLKSRIVPYIAKWVYTTGKDVRDNPYRLNYHRSFGNMNFSPSDDMLITDPKFHTHEWPYLDSVPDNYPLSTFPEYAFSYMFDKITDKYDFSSLTRDWFSEYFTVGYPSDMYIDTNGDYVSAVIDSAEKYSFFEYKEYNDSTEVFFRGHKFSINEIDINNEIVKFSSKYDGYKFSAIIKTVEETQFEKTEPISFQMIVNEKWKFMLLKIIINVSSYRFLKGNLRYIDLYTMMNNDAVSTFEYDPSYSSILSNYKLAIPTDRKIPNINLSNYSQDPSLPSTLSYYDIYTEYPNYKYNINEDIVPLSSGNYSDIVNFFENGSLYRTTTMLNTPTEIYSNLTLKIPNTVAYEKLSLLPIEIHNNIPNSSINWNNYVSFHQGGGNSSYSGIRNRMIFAEIVKVMTETSTKSNMSYFIYKEDGSQTDAKNFKVESISPEKITRIYDYYPVKDLDKPQEFYSLDMIGSVLDVQKDIQSLYRYHGNFVPKFRDIFKFWLREDDEFSDTMSRDFLLNNTHLGVELNDFSILKNQYYTKVSDSEILKLSPSSAYKPVYPMIDEIAIDKRDIFAWSSTWDNLYYRKYSSTSDYVDLKGTEEMKEIKSLLGSKVMKLPKKYSLYEYSIKESSPSNFSTLVDDEFLYFEDEFNAYLQVNVYNRLLREMMGDADDLRAKSEFIKAYDLVPDAFDPLFIDDIVKNYLTKNILELFQITDIKLYVLQSGNSGSIATTQSLPRPLIEFNVLNADRFTLTEPELLSRGYSVRKDVNVTNVKNMVFQIKYPLDSRFYTSLSLGVTVNRI